MTIYDIAKEAGVSASTVSRVINNKKGIKNTTKTKVENILKKYDFHLDENAKGLVTKKTKLIAILVADIRLEHHNNISYLISKKLMEFGYCTIVINVGTTTEDVDDAVGILRQRKVDGIILVGSIFQVDQVEYSIKTFFSDIPVIMANGYLPLDNVYGIEINEYQGIRDAVKLLYSKGYTKIAFIGSLNTISNRQKRNGYLDQLRCHSYQDEPIVLDIDKTNDSYEEIQELFSIYKGIDAVIFSDDILLFKHLRFFEENGKRIPDDLGLIGVNNDFFCTLTTPTLTTIDNKMEDTALAVVSTLIGVLNGEQKVNRIMLFTKIIERESTKKR
ncbi:MAG: LacI family DNA-binding transcriptional regulator [Sphaerochaetaceae bacterium]|nr:LacI family DNA-binding transcriptional regulator [Sphaerochaetaceae bacterium]